MSWLDAWKNITGRKITLYADFIDPFCYIGFHNLRPLAEARGILLDWHGFELNPDTPAEGLTLETGANSDLRQGMWASVEQFAKTAGLSFPEPRWVPNTRAAHGLVKNAAHKDVKNPLIDSLYHAYFKGQKDISQVEVLIDLASAFGISADTVRAAVFDSGLAHSLEARRTEARRRGFLGLPGFVYKGKTHFGALSEAAWKNILEEDRRGR